MDYASPHKIFKLGKQRTLGTEKKVKVLTEGSILAVGESPGGQSCKGPEPLAPKNQAGL